MQAVCVACFLRSSRFFAELCEEIGICLGIVAVISGAGNNNYFICSVTSTPVKLAFRQRTCNNGYKLIAG